MMTAMTPEQLRARVADLAREVGVLLDAVRYGVGPGDDLDLARQAAADAERRAREITSLIWSLRGERTRAKRRNGPQR